MEHQPISKIEYENTDPKMNDLTNLRDVVGNIRMSSILPVGGQNFPRKLVDQFQIYVSGATKRLYVADLTNNTWYFINLT